MQVRPLIAQDAVAWHALLCHGTESHPSGFLMSLAEVSSMSAERQRATLAQGNVYGVISDTAEILGFASLHLRSLDRIRHRADIGPFYIHARHHGTGAADVLMAALASRAKVAGVDWLDLWVAEGNGRAKSFYTRHGFVEVGRREDAVRIDGTSETDLMMTRHLVAVA